MQIDDFIKSMYMICDDPPIKITNLFPTEKFNVPGMFNIDIDVKDIFSHYVFPRLIEYGGKKTMIFDSCHYYIYNQMLVNFCAFMDSLRSSQNDMNNPRAKLAMKNITDAFYYFLLVKFQTSPEEAFPFAYEYYLRTRKYLTFEPPSDAKLHYLFYYHYCIFHELQHYRYHAGADLSREKKHIRYVMKLTDDRYGSGGVPDVDKELVEAHIAEELLCDAHAYTTSASFISNIGIKDYSNEKIYTKCAESCLMLNFFNSLLVFMHNSFSDLYSLGSRNEAQITEQRERRWSMLNSRRYYFELVLFGEVNKCTSQANQQ